MQVSGDDEVQRKLDKTGESAEKLGQKAETAAGSAQQVQRNYLGAASGLSVAASGAASLWFQFDNLQKRELAVQRASASLTSAQATLQSAQNSLTNMVEKGITSGGAYEAAQLRVKAAQEQLMIAEQKVAITQGDLSQAQLGFALSVVPTSIAAIGGVTQAMTALGIVTKGQNGQMILSSGIFKGETASKIINTTATWGYAAATKAATLATKLLHLAMGPVGLAILGVSTFMALFATNAFGIRDAINAAGKAIGDAIPILRPLLDMLAGLANTIFPQAEEKTQAFSGAATDSLSNVAAQYPELASASQLSTEQVTADYDEMANKAAQMQELTTASMGLMTDNIGTSVTAQKASFTDLGKAAVDMGNVVAQSFNSAAAAASAAAQRIVDAARQAAAAMASIGASRASTSGTTVRAAATGMNETVHRPTLILAGEAGPEQVNITPIGASGNAGGGNGTVQVTTVLMLDGSELARSVSRHQARSL